MPPRQKLEIFLCSLLVLAGAAAAQAAQKPSGKSRENGPSAIGPKAPLAGSRELPLNPTIYLLRDPAIHLELRLDASAKQAMIQLANDANEPFWQLRNASPDKGPGSDNLRLLRTQLSERLDKIVTPAQRERLQQIGLQLQGVPAFSQPEVVQQLALAEGQQKKLTKLLEDFETAMKELRAQAAAGKDLPELNRNAKRLNTGLGKNLYGILNASQRDRWQKMLGKTFDATRLQPLSSMAPELRDVGAWVNGQPVTLKGLRGRVVLLHFYTFGCINCIHNFPAYKNYQEKFKNRDVTLVGIHTPETPGEKVVETVRKKAEENGFNFPIAVDNDLKNWQAWGNSMWPAVYVIDKRGYVRYWWYGELNWQGASGEKYIAGKIEELLAEK